MILIGKVYISLTHTKARRPERVDQAAGGDAIKGRDVPPYAGGYEIFVSLAADGNRNKALAKGLKQRLVSGVVAIVAGRAAGNQKNSQGEGGARH